jgi:hypothetical protein
MYYIEENKIKNNDNTLFTSFQFLIQKVSMKDRLVKSLETQFIMIQNTAANTTTTIHMTTYFRRIMINRYKLNLMDIINILFLFAK